MSDLDLDAIKARLRNVEDNSDQCQRSPGQVSVSGYWAACVDSSRDVPNLVAEVERLERLLAEPFPTSDGYEAMAQALTDMRGLVVEMARHFPNVGSPDPRDTVRSDWVPAVSVARWKRIAAEVPR